MNELPPCPSRARVLVLAPTARDALATRSLFAGLPVEIATCSSVPELCGEAREGAGVLVLTDDALTPDGMAGLADLLSDQPPWSDLPVLVLVRRGMDAHRTILTLEKLGNVTLLDRPVPAALLVSAVRTALRARERQYQLRAHLAEQERIREALRQADRMKDEFLAMLAHELRNPLAAIVNAATVLGSVCDLPEVARQQAVIDRQSRHTARLLDDLLDVSRITQGRIELRCRPLELVRAVRLAAASVQPRIEERGHRFSLELPSDPVWVDGDPARVEQILTNLLTNAVKYTPHGGVIRMSLETTGETAVLRVRDNGIGISPDLLPRIFDLFTQAQRSLDRSEGGVGIGLTMVKRLVEMHGGTVEARSDGPDLGSEFIVRLPVVMPAAAPGAEIAPTPSGAPERAAPRKVLVVEDNPDAAATLADLLELWGHEPHVVHRGEDALEQVEALSPDLLLIDVGLPGIDGFEVARRLRASGAAGPARLIAVTGYGQQDDRRRSEEAGFDLHLTKPVDPEALRTLLSRLR